MNNLSIFSNMLYACEKLLKGKYCHLKGNVTEKSCEYDEMTSE